MATLTVTIQEDLILNGNDRSNTNTATFVCNELDHRVVTITNVEKSILLFDSANEAGTIKDTKLEYLRITNLDGSATVNLRVRDDAQEFMIQLKAGGSFLLTKDKLDADATGSEESISLAQINKISAVSSATTCLLEVYAAAQNV
jgi:predicted  nucleic acid-binding Zn-ribbon protein